MENSSEFFANTSCEYFPCHEGVAPEEFNCMFCYCPLYMLGPDCGGNFYYTKSGSKSCKNCNLPHRGIEGTKWVTSRYPEIKRRTMRPPEKPEA
jgi:cobalt-precorrin-5B (C1)-methyltransferase